jgi:hypothetical protein
VGSVPDSQQPESAWARRTAAVLVWELVLEWVSAMEWA